MGLGQKWDGFETFTVEEAGCEILRLSRESAYAAARSGNCQPSGSAGACLCRGKV
jgi:hypothetical protein